MRDMADIYRTIAYAPSKDADIKRENANIDGESSMGAMLKYGSEGAKAFNLDEVIPDEFSKAHENGDLHIHDMDFYTLTDTCCQIDVGKLLQKGFYTGHGFIRPPSNIKTAANLACIIIQSNQNDMHGGQSIPMLDYALAPYVRKSYVKNWRREVEELLVYRHGWDEKDARHKAEQMSVKYEPRIGRPYWPFEESFCVTKQGITQAADRAEAQTRNDVYQAMEALVHNLNTMQSRAGSQVPFSSVNYGTDTSPEGRLVTEMLLKATDAGLGEGETPIFPVQIFKIKDGVNYKPGDPNYDLFKLSIKVSAKRLYPNWESLDAPFNLQYYKAGDPDTEVATMGCRTRVMGNVWDPTRETTSGRGNLSFTTINLPRLGIEAHGDLDKFFADLDSMLDLCMRQLLHRLSIQKARRVRNYPFLMGEGVWMDSEKLGWDDPVGDILKHGTLSIGFIGLAECLTALVGKHHGEDAEARELGLRIVTHMRHWMDRKSRELKLNVTCLATPAEGLCLAKGTIVQGVYGNKPIEEVKAGDLLYSFNEEKGVVEIDKVEKCWMTSKARKVLKITFDTGQELVCTPNHPLARRVLNQDELGRFVPVDGHSERMEWIEAGDVKPGMRIKSNYLSESENGYDKVSGSGEKFVHRLVYEYFSGSEVPEGYVVHHKDGNKKNNIFDNFELMTDAAHRAHHLSDTIGRYCYTSEGMTGEKNPFYGKRHTSETKAKISAAKRGQIPHNRASLPGVLEKYNAGVPVRELQRMYGCATPSPIYRELKALGVKFKPSGSGRKPAVPTEDLISSYYKGLSIPQIAKQYGMSHQNVRQRLNRAGVIQPNHVVVKVEMLEQKAEVWDITMSKNHSFYVGGDQGILVHNSGRFVKIDREKYGEIAGVTDRDYYTNSFHVPVWYNISASKKVDIEAPYHALCNAGHITYIELDGDTAKNLDAMETLVRYMHDKGCGYYAISHPVDRDPVCGYVGVINGVCPRCGRREGEAISEEKLEAVRKKWKVR